MNLLNFVKLTIENNGATYNINSGEINPDNGYFVAIKSREEKTLAEDVKSKVAAYVNDNSFTLSLRGCYLGSWIDKGILYLDVVKKFEDKEEAINFGIVNKQLAIYDANKKEVIEL